MNEPSEAEVEPVNPISGFWRRVGAFFVDLVILGLVGLSMGLLWSDSFATMGTNARVFGFVPALMYFGLLNSRLTNGQTIGKRLLRIKVVDRTGSPLPILLSLARFLPIGLPWFLNGLWLSVDQLNSWLGNILSFVIFGIGISVVYLFVFNRRTRQSLHDLLVGSYVVRSDVSEELAATDVWRPHLVVCSVLLILGAAGPLITSQFANSGPYPGLLNVQDRVSSLPWVIHAQPTSGTQTFTSVKKGKSTTSYFHIVALILDDDIENERRAIEVMTAAIEAHPDVQESEVLQVTLVYGFDIGIASSWRRRTFSDSPSNWLGRATAL